MVVWGIGVVGVCECVVMGVVGGDKVWEVLSWRCICELDIRIGEVR